MSRQLLILPPGESRDERTDRLRINAMLTSGVVSTNATITDTQYMTTTEYQALPTKDADTIYITTDPEGIYVGDRQVADLGGALLLGLYNAPGDTVDAGIGSGSPLAAANTYNTGEYYVLSVGGTFSTPLPELNGLTGATNDRIYADAAANKWLLVTSTGDFLSRLTNDTAAGIITFSQPAKGAAPAAASDEYIRKQESDSRDDTTDSNLATHIADADVHYPDVPNDDISYVRRNKIWHTNTNEAFLWGPPSSFTLNTSVNILQNWPDNADVGSMDLTVDPIAGTITLPVTGLYRITQQMVGNQGNDNKEESMWSLLRVVGGAGAGDYRTDVFAISDDKTSYRALGASFVRPFDAGAVLSFGMQATTGLGTFTFETASFEVMILEGITSEAAGGGWPFNPGVQWP